MARDELIENLYQFLNTADWRIVAMTTEEAGEVQGAFNKWQDGNTRKPKDAADVLEETVQLLACCLILGHHWGVDSEEMLRRADQFLAGKAEELG